MALDKHIRFAAVALVLATGAAEAQKLPRSQQLFREHAVKAVSQDLLAGAHMAQAAYDAAPPKGWARVQTTGKPSAVFLYRIDAEHDLVEVAVRGTASFEDVLSDLKASVQEDEWLQIPLHTGFRAVAQEVYQALREALPPALWTSHRFRLYGHSMGGAAASIVAMYLHQQGTHVDLVASYGAPQFTTNEGARKYQVLNQRTYRVVRCDDVVPFLPPPNFWGWSNGSYQANGNVLLLLLPPFFDFSVGLDIERDFVHQLRTELTNQAKHEDLAFGHRMSQYTALLQSFARPAPPGRSPAMTPVSYRLAQQAQLCPARLTPPN